VRARPLPAWLELALLPGLDLALALPIAGLVVVVIGEDPIAAVGLLVYGAFGYGEAVGYTLFYTTNFIFTGLAVAIAFHAGHFNIGGEGQADLGGLGLTLVAPPLGHLPSGLSIPLAIAGAALFGGLWALIPGWLYARRGSHVVITTIMMNFIAAALMTFSWSTSSSSRASRSPRPTSSPRPSGCRRARRSSPRSASTSVGHRPIPACCWRSLAASLSRSLSGGAVPATNFGSSGEASPRRSMPGSRPPG
jgi:ABC-type uncharacterized transport system permease subunit